MLLLLLLLSKLLKVVNVILLLLLSAGNGSLEFPYKFSSLLLLVVIILSLLMVIILLLLISFLFFKNPCSTIPSLLLLIGAPILIRSKGLEGEGAARLFRLRGCGLLGLGL